MLTKFRIDSGLLCQDTCVECLFAVAGCTDGRASCMQEREVVKKTSGEFLDSLAEEHAQAHSEARAGDWQHPQAEGRRPGPPGAQPALAGGPAAGSGTGPSQPGLIAAAALTRSGASEGSRGSGHVSRLGSIQSDDRHTSKLGELRLRSPSRLQAAAAAAAKAVAKRDPGHEGTSSTPTAGSARDSEMAAANIPSSGAGGDKAAGEGSRPASAARRPIVWVAPKPSARPSTDPLDQPLDARRAAAKAAAGTAPGTGNPLDRALGSAKAPKSPKAKGRRLSLSPLQDGEWAPAEEGAYMPKGNGQAVGGYGRQARAPLPEQVRVPVLLPGMGNGELEGTSERTVILEGRDGDAGQWAPEFWSEEVPPAYGRGRGYAPGYRPVSGKQRKGHPGQYGAPGHPSYANAGPQQRGQRTPPGYGGQTHRHAIPQPVEEGYSYDDEGSEYGASLEEEAPPHRPRSGPFGRGRGAPLDPAPERRYPDSQHPGRGQGGRKAGSRGGGQGRGEYDGGHGGQKQAYGQEVEQEEYGPGDVRLLPPNCYYRLQKLIVRSADQLK